jgi:hypothetical protein
LCARERVVNGRTASEWNLLMRDIEDFEVECVSERENRWICWLCGFKGKKNGMMLMMLMMSDGIDSANNFSRDFLVIDVKNMMKK